MSPGEPEPSLLPSLPSRLFHPLLPAPCPSLCLTGFVESELKKLLAVQRDSRLWKVGSHDGQELLTEPEITLEEAGIVNGQVCPSLSQTTTPCLRPLEKVRPPTSIGP